LNTAVEANQKVFGRLDEPKTQIAMAELASAIRTDTPKRFLAGTATGASTLGSRVSGRAA
jgi:hypothetical protein